MNTTTAHNFKAVLELIGINPYVFVPLKILQAIFAQANKKTSPIPIKGTLNDKPFKQTLVKYKGEWRLYVNLIMLDNSPKRIGETVQITVAFDPEDRTFAPHPKLALALIENAAAKQVFDALTTYKQQELIRYISRLKSEESINRNVERAINFLLGKERFLGRDKP